MDVSTDTFPRDEVTGLAAFDHLDPISTVSTLNVMPEPPAPPPRVLTPPPPPPGAALSRPPSLAPRPSQTGSTLPPPPQASRTFSRPVAAPATTLPPAPFVPPASLRADATEQVDLDDPGLRLAPAASEYEGWEDPEDVATRVVNQASAAVPAADLQMDWDEEEPPTMMRGETSATSPYEAAAEPSFDEPAYAALESGRPSPFPAARESYIPKPAAVPTLRPGAPSPFAHTHHAHIEDPLEPTWDETALRRDKRPLVIGAAAVAVVAIGLLSRALLSPPAPAMITLATKPIDARVTVDGKPVLGSASPFSATDLAPGEHELLVHKDGFSSYRTKFVVNEGETVALSPVELTPEAHEMGFEIQSNPPGAEVRVDGRSLGLVTPARITDVVPGLHKIELVAEGHSPFELQVFVPENAVLTLPTATLAALPRQKASSLPAVTDALERPENTQVAVRKTSARPKAVKARRGARAGRASASFARKAAAAAKPAAPTSGQGIVRVNSRPWSQVYVDGKLRGNTPQMGLQLPAGKHTLKLVNPAMGLSKTITIDLRAGETVTKVVNLIE